MGEGVLLRKNKNDPKGSSIIAVTVVGGPRGMTTTCLGASRRRPGIGWRGYNRPIK